ncbi:MAG: ISAs1 family transposase [Tenericutes bacterium]|nr:ISAs1 family transposase [Mycoplasmatota bacterium]
MLLELLLEIKEFRNKKGIRYEFAYIIYFSILATLSNADSYRKISTFIEERFEELKEKYTLSWKKPPSYSVIRNIIIALPGDDLEDVFRKFTRKLLNIPSNEMANYSLDGKVLRGSYDHFNKKSATQLLSVFCSNSNLIMAHEEVSCKTNEIPIAQKIIPELKIKDSIFTSDAINCQTKTIDVVKVSGNDLIVQVKNNQKFLLNNLKEITIHEAHISEYKEPTTKERNRIESRHTKIYSTKNILAEKWSKIKNIVKIKRRKKIFNTKKGIWENKGETAYYISTKEITAKEANKYIRNHWGIENKNHHVKDATMNEDGSRIRVKPQNMARFKSFALNIMRFNGVKNIKKELFKNSLKLSNITNYGSI